MSEVVAPVVDGPPTIGEAGGGFNVFSSLRDGASSEDFSSGAGDIGEEATAGVDEAAGSLTWWRWPVVKKNYPPLRKCLRPLVKRHA